MAKKKSSKQKNPEQKEFSSSPFKNLKGLSAFQVPVSQSKDKTDESEAVETAKPSSSAEEHCSFADEMDLLGVKPLSGEVAQGPVIGDELKVKPDSLPESSREERDKAAFLDALGSMETTFKDEWSEEEPEKQAVPRRMKQVERGQLKPEAELDLHGLTVDEASGKVKFFLQDSVYQGFQTTLIITGKGLHSKEGPVLRTAVEKLLSQHKEQVLEWGHAPQRYGGSGALVVFLRSLPE